ncbi:MAG: hypothetical protein JOZ72_08320 [Alphaproteobacteria bacterium]|nr:hypothetical protein [Alphaproteobacteria bacterium]
MQGPFGSSGNSSDRDTVVVRVVALRADGLELEYDLPKSASPDECAADWQFPFRVFKPVAGEARLLDAAELDARVDTWLKDAKLSRASCGHWFFTWNAFRIECDPQSVLETVEAFDLDSPDVREGTTAVDPETVRRKRAEADVVAIPRAWPSAARA